MLNLMEAGVRLSAADKALPSSCQLASAVQIKSQEKNNSFDHLTSLHWQLNIFVFVYIYNLKLKNNEMATNQSQPSTSPQPLLNTPIAHKQIHIYNTLSTILYITMATSSFPKVFKV